MVINSLKAAFMATNYRVLSLTLLLISLWQPVFSQLNLDSAQGAETWKVKKNKGIFGLAKPDFGPYRTINITKLDSAVHRKKIKDPEGATASVSGSEGFDITKQQTIEKQKWFKLLLGSQTDTTAAVFVIASTSLERKQTLIGKMLSKNDESSGAVLNYSRDVSGTISAENDSTNWEFLITTFTSGGRQTEMQIPHASIGAVYLKNGSDSVYTKTGGWQSANVALYTSDGQALATLEFTGNTASIWMRKDATPSYQRAVAGLFAVIIAIKDI